MRIRLATPEDADQVAELATVAGVDLDDAVRAGLVAGTVASGLRTGLRSGPKAFHREIATHLTNNSPSTAGLSACLVLVADHRTAGIIGTLIAFPPTAVIAGFADHASSVDEQQQHVVCGLIGLAKIHAMAVAEPARGSNIGGSLLKRTCQLYFHCGYFLLYGAIRGDPDLAQYYTHRGFKVLAEGQRLSLWPVFDTGGVLPYHGERFFVRYHP